MKRPSSATDVSGEAGALSMDQVSNGDAPFVPATVGQRLRRERERQGIGVREMSRRVNLSASLISQIELGRATPSVGTLYAIVNELNISLDALFFESDVAATAEGPAPAAATEEEVEDRSHPPGRRHQAVVSEEGPRALTPVVRGDERQTIRLGSGVTWERMNADHQHDVDFLYVIYDVGGASAPDSSLIRHGGREYGHILEGTLGVTVGFETYHLQSGDAISFESTTPHRLFNAGDAPVKAIWFVVGRGTPHLTRGA